VPEPVSKSPEIIKQQVELMRYDLWSVFRHFKLHPAQKVPVPGTGLNFVLKKAGYRQKDILAPVVKTVQKIADNHRIVIADLLTAHIQLGDKGLKLFQNLTHFGQLFLDISSEQIDAMLHKSATHVL
jgi:hypothetical protein